MKIKVHIPSYLRFATGDAEIVEVSGNTVGECLGELVKAHPDIEDKLFDSGGSIRAYVGIYLNADDTYPEGLAMKVSPGDEIYLLYTIGGG